MMRTKVGVVLVLVGTGLLSYLLGMGFALILFVDGATDTSAAVESSDHLVTITELRKELEGCRYQQDRIEAMFRFRDEAEAQDILRYMIERDKEKIKQL